MEPILALLRNAWTLLAALALLISALGLLARWTAAAGGAALGAERMIREAIAGSAALLILAALGFLVVPELARQLPAVAECPGLPEIYGVLAGWVRGLILALGALAMLRAALASLLGAAVGAPGMVGRAVAEILGLAIAQSLILLIPPLAAALGGCGR